MSYFNTYIDIGHQSDPEKTELWWVHPETSGLKLERVCPLGTWTHKRDHGYATHYDLVKDFFMEGRYAQGRVEHNSKRVSLVMTPTHRSNPFFVRTVEHLLTKAFPGYDIVGFD